MSHRIYTPEFKMRRSGRWSSEATQVKEVAERLGDLRGESLHLAQGGGTEQG